MNARVLLIDASLPVAVVAVGDDDGVRASVTLREQRQHSEHLALAVQRVLVDAEVTIGAVTAIAVGRGPGSYMGIRTAMALAQGLAFARAVPLRGFGSLEALRAGADVELAVAPAKRGFWYGQRSGQSSLWLDETALRELALSSASLVVPASGIEAFWQALAPLAWTDEQRRLVTVADALQPQALWQAWFNHRDGNDEIDTLGPDYVRAPDAALPLRDPAWQLDAVRAMTSQHERE